MRCLLTCDYKCVGFPSVSQSQTLRLWKKRVKGSKKNPTAIEECFFAAIPSSSNNLIPRARDRLSRDCFVHCSKRSIKFNQISVQSLAQNQSDSDMKREKL